MRIIQRTKEKVIKNTANCFCLLSPWIKGVCYHSLALPESNRREGGAIIWAKKSRPF